MWNAEVSSQNNRPTCRLTRQIASVGTSTIPLMEAHDNIRVYWLNKTHVLEDLHMQSLSMCNNHRCHLHRLISEYKR